MTQVTPVPYRRVPGGVPVVTAEVAVCSSHTSDSVQILTVATAPVEYLSESVGDSRFSLSKLRSSVERTAC